MRADPLLENYPIRIREVAVGVLIGISGIFYIFPKALGESTKTDYIIKEEMETFDIPQTEQIEIPEPPARPSVPVASEDDFLDEDYDVFDPLTAAMRADSGSPTDPDLGRKNSAITYIWLW